MPLPVNTPVNSFLIFLYWPNKNPKTDFYWARDEKFLKKLEELAEKATKFCYGKNMNEPIGGDFISVGVEMGSQQYALAGLIYARELGKIKEIAEMGKRRSIQKEMEEVFET